MQAKATLKNLRISPKKVKLVADLIKGMDSGEAQNQLSFLNKRAAKAVLKLLNSAIANGENNLGLEKSNLFIKDIRVDSGITIKRWRARAFGRASMIRKKTSHVNIILDEKVPTIPKKVKKSDVAPVSDKIKKDDSKDKIAKSEDLSKSTPVAVDKEKSPIRKKDSKTHRSNKGFTKKIFQRKSG